MIRIQPCFGMTESGAALLPPQAAARLARAFASVLPPGGRILLFGDDAPAVRPALLACRAQFAFMGHVPEAAESVIPSMGHWLVPHFGYAGGMGFAGNACWLIGADGRCLNEAMWECVLAKFDGGSPEDAATAAAPDGVLSAEAVGEYWTGHLQSCVDAAKIRQADLRVACTGLKECGRFKSIFGVEMLPFATEEAASGALPYLNAACGMIFEPSGKRLQLMTPSGAVCTPDVTMLLAGAIMLERGEKSIVSGGFMTKSWRELVRRHDVEPGTVPMGEGSAIVSGMVCGDLFGNFSFGGHPGYDALRTAALLLEFFASGGDLDEQLNKLRRYHLLRREIPRGAAAIMRLKGRFNADETTEYDGGLEFDFADGALSATPLANGRALVCSEARKLQDARERLETALAVLSAGGAR